MRRPLGGSAHQQQRAATWMSRWLGMAKLLLLSSLFPAFFYLISSVWARDELTCCHPSAAALLAGKVSCSWVQGSKKVRWQPEEGQEHLLPLQPLQVRAQRREPVAAQLRP